MKNILNKCLLIALLACLPGLIQAQRVLIRGVVTAYEDKQPLPGAYLLLQNSDGRVVANTITDYEGNYSLLSVIKPGDVLVVSYSGFKKQTIPVENREIINVEMREEILELETATVVGRRQISSGMMSISERDLTTAAVRIEMSELEDLAVASIDDALQGRVAGMDMVTTSGAPGAGMSIRIRGTTSINGSSQPYIIVDGFPYETTISEDFDFSTADEEEYSQMLNIAPGDIKEIIVLKDAAATAIWGSKAANGVLQITTKRGGISPPTVTLGSKGTMSKQAKGIPTLNGDQYVGLILEAMMNSGRTFNPESYPELANDANNPYFYHNYGQNTDWFNELTQTGWTQDHNLAISGGSGKAQYRASVGYYNEEGTTVGTGFERITTRLNVDYNVSEKFRFTANMSYNYSETDRAFISYLRSSYDVLSQAYVRAPNMAVYEYNEAGILTGNFCTPASTLQGYWSGSASSIYNPVAMADESMYKMVSNRIIPNLSVIWNPSSVLRYQFDVGFDVMNNKANAFLPVTATGRPWTESTVNRASDSDSEAFVLQTFNKFLYTPKLGDDHSLQLLAGVNTYDKMEKGFAANASNSASPYLTDPSNGARVAGLSGLGISSSSGQNRSINLFAQLHYTLLDRYIFSATLRRDGSSRFGQNHRWGTYPSASLRYRISGEPFMRKQSERWLDELSLRASYGVNGAQPRGNYASVATYDVFNFEYLGASGTYQRNLELVDLRWENTTQANIGLNFASFKNRLGFDFEWYHKETRDLFMYNLKIPTSTGFSSVNTNVGRMDNNGWEFQCFATPVKTKDWTLTLNLNFARNDNRLREISDLYPQESGISTSNASYISQLIVDQPLGSFYGYLYDGVYLNEDQTIARDKKGDKIYTYNDKGEKEPVYMRFSYPSIDYQFQPGDARYVDVNHDGNIDYQDIVWLGNAMALFSGGFGGKLSWKQFTVDAFFNFRYGNDVINFAKLNMENMHAYDNQSLSVLRRWRHVYEDESEAPDDLLPRALYRKGYNYLASDRFVEDGSFVRFKSLTFRYNMSRDQLKNTFLQRASFFITLQNLYVWTAYTGMDPEVNISNPLSAGYDYASTPRPKDYMIGFSLTF